MLDDAEAQNHPARGLYQLSVPPDPTYRGTAKAYFARILGNISGSQKSSKDIRMDKSKIPSKHRGQGWMQAGNGADDSDSADERPATRKQDSKNSDSPTSMTVSDLDTLSSSNGFAPTTSDAASSVRFDPHAVRGLSSYADQLPSSLTRQSVMPSIQSQLHSPQSSQSFLSSPSQMPMTPPERTTSPASIDNDIPFPADSRPPLRTFESGSKFIEGL